MTAIPLDHLVINTRFETIRAAQLFQGLGFTLTPRGRHAFGSVNHLMVFDDDYLELIGLPEDGGPLRQEILNNPTGIDGLVFNAIDAAAIHRRLATQGFRVQPLHSFTRPVDLGDGQAHEAGFHTVRFETGQFEAGRVYFCQHVTPQLIWRTSLQQHANTAYRLAGLVVVSAQPEVDAAKLARVCEGAVTADSEGVLRIAGDKYAVLVTAPGRYADQYGEFGCSASGRRSFFGAIVILVRDLEALGRTLDQTNGEVRVRREARRTLVSLPVFNTLLDFREGDSAV